VTIRTDASRPALPARSAVAVRTLQAFNWLSRRLGRGSGTVAGGRVGLAIDPGLLAELTGGRPVALVTGTTGKTTTTRMLVAALTGGETAVIASNDTGANMPAGHVAALAGTPDSVPAVLEVDEGYLSRLIEETRPRVVILLNLSRDQLDRISEVRMLVERWRSALATLPRVGDRPGAGTTVVANADDPMVAWAASTAPRVCWVGVGQVWRHDSVGCPACGGRIVFGDTGGWSCDQCEFARPRLDAWLEGAVLVTADGARHPVDIGLPGQFNRGNAAMVAMAAPFMTGGDPEADGGTLSPDVPTALARLGSIDQVAGRFGSIVRKGHPVRMLLAKNPAGWTAIFDLLEEQESEPGAGGPPGPVVLSINARTADGLDTSWLWDVPFERLAGRPVVATGDRRLDLAVRLRYAEVDHTVAAGPLAALDRAVEMASAPAPIDFLGNYTAFADLRTSR
jgi:UDP-N-acetylmuramyl tripeptide synthase